MVFEFATRRRLLRLDGRFLGLQFAVGGACVGHDRFMPLLDGGQAVQGRDGRVDIAARRCRLLGGNCGIRRADRRVHGRHGRPYQVKRRAVFQKPRVSRQVDDLEGCLRLAIEEIQHGRFQTGKRRHQCRRHLEAVRRDGAITPPEFQGGRVGRGLRRQLPGRPVTEILLNGRAQRGDVGFQLVVGFTEQRTISRDQRQALQALAAIGAFPIGDERRPLGQPRLAVIGHLVRRQMGTFSSS